MKNLLLTLLLISTTTFAEVPATAINPLSTKELLCQKGGYTSGKDTAGEDVRKVTTANKKAVYAAAKVIPGTNPIQCFAGPGKSPYAIDHRISLQLGGSNHISNLMLQPYCGPWNARDKDKLENALRRDVCKGTITLKKAQDLIYNNWENAYVDKFGP
jgi:hypothetical protein